MILENQLALLDPSSFQHALLWGSSKHVLEQPEACSPEVQGCAPAFCIAASSWAPRLYHLMVTAAKVAPTFIPPASSSLLVSSQTL